LKNRGHPCGALGARFESDILHFILRSFSEGGRGDREEKKKGEKKKE